jgi:phage shock protein A
VDADGVALAAIQGLNQKVEERQHRLEEQLRSRDAEVAALKKNLADLQQRVAQLNRQTQLP